MGIFSKNPRISYHINMSRKVLQFKKDRWPLPNLLELEGLKVILLELCQWAQKTRIIQSTWQELRTCVKWSYISYQSINYVNWSNASSLLSQVWTIELSNSSALISLMITKYLEALPIYYNFDCYILLQYIYYIL